MQALFTCRSLAVLWLRIDPCLFLLVGLGLVHQALSEGLEAAQQQASLETSHAHMAAHFGQLDSDVRHVLINGSMFLYFALRNTKDTPR